MNLAFTIAIILFVLPYFIRGDIFGFNVEHGESDTTLLMLKNICEKE